MHLLLFKYMYVLFQQSICGRGDLIPVVVKCCERVDNEKEEFFTEVELLKKFVHQNIISLLGIQSSATMALHCENLHHVDFHTVVPDLCRCV